MFSTQDAEVLIVSLFLRYIVSLYMCLPPSSHQLAEIIFSSSQLYVKVQFFNAPESKIYDPNS